DVRTLIDQAHDEAWKVLSVNRDVLDKLATELLDKETLDHNQLAEIFKDVVKLDDRPQWLSSEDRPVSDRPPVEVPVKISIDDPAAHGEKVKKKTTRKPRSAPGIATA